MTFEEVMEDINALESVDDRMEVLAELYFAFYHRNFKEVMTSRVVTAYRKEANEEIMRTKKIVDALMAERELLKQDFLKKNYPDNPAKVQRFYNYLPEDRKYETDQRYQNKRKTRIPIMEMDS